MRNKKFELLAPAGSFETFKAVIAAGADAVYVGGTRFGARAYANNFTEEELLQAIDYAHLRGVKVYLTVNTLLKNQEIKELYAYLKPFYERGLDAVLVQDFGALRLIHECFPDIELHTSTQMTVTGTEGVKLLKDYGVSRVVMAREMSLAEMKKIHDETGMELEAFVHGALCYCYSGQCLFSSMLGGRSGNRGRCAQPCRLPYTVDKENSYILSLKDMCGIRDIPKLGESGVYSLKIEGRMKKPSYAAGIVSLYRKYIDNYEKGYELSKEDEKHIWELGNRCGFTDSYYHRHNDSDMVTYVKPNYATDNEAYHESIIEKYVNASHRLPISGKAYIYEAAPISMEVSFTDLEGRCYSAYVTGDEAMSAKNVPLSEEAVASRLSKTGDTDFELTELEVSLGENVFVPNGALNQLRRDAIDALYNEILSIFRRESKEISATIFENTKKAENVEIYKEKDCFLVSVEKKEQLDLVLKEAMFQEVYLGHEVLTEDAVNRVIASGKEAFGILPSISRNSNEKRIRKLIGIPGLKGFVVKNYEEFNLVKTQTSLEIIADHNLYSYNDLAKRELILAGASHDTIPLELNSLELSERENTNSEMIIYGYYPLMTTAGCVHKNTKGCDQKSQLTYLKDRYNVSFPVRNYCSDCYNVIYNSLPTMLIGRLDAIKKSGVSRFRVSFTIENASDTLHILDIISGREAIGKKDEFTNGHFKRGVE